MPPGKSWIFFFKILGSAKTWKITSVLESHGKLKPQGPGKSWKNILENHAFLNCLYKHCMYIETMCK